MQGRLLHFHLGYNTFRNLQRYGELPHRARADALAEGRASCFHDVVRLRLTAHQTLSGERALQRQAYPQGAQSP